MISKASAALLFCLLAMTSYSVLADELTPAKRADVRALLQATGGGNVYQQYADLATVGIVQQLQGRPGFTRKIAEAVRSELGAIYKEGMSSAGGLSDRIEQIYARYYTHQEVRDLLAFFRSPLGEKFIAAGPALSNEILAAGKAWGNGMTASIESRLRSRLKQEGFDLPPSVAPASKPAAGAPAEKK